MFIRQRPRGGGFTLMEMLLVVAIIAILISILLPNLSKVRTATRGSVCSTNLNYIHSATVQYTIANAGYYPRANEWVGSQWWNINSVRGGKLYSYMGKNETSYICPEFAATPKAKWTTAYDWGGMQNYQNFTPAFTYTLNEYMSSGGWMGKPAIRKIQLVDEPSKLCWYGEENPWMIPGLSNHPINNGCLGIGWIGDSGIVDCLATFHQPKDASLNDGSSNVLHADGHVALVHVSKTKEIVTPRRWKP